MSTVVLIGVGGFGACWRDALDDLPDTTVVGLVDPDEAALARAGDAYGVPAEHRVARIEDLPLTVRADYVIDSSPFVHHVRHAREVFARGADLVVAKPMAATAKDGAELLAAAARAGREVVVAHQMRYFAPLRELRELLRRGTLGEVRHVRVEMALDGRGWEPGTAWRLKLDDPLVLEAGVHHLDLLTWVLDAGVTSVDARGWRGAQTPFAGTDSVSALLDTTAGYTVHYTASFAPAPPVAIRFDSGWTVVGELGRATVTNGGLTFFDAVTGRTSVLLPETPAPAELDALNAELLADWRGARSDALCWGPDNLETLRVLDAVRDSIRKRAPMDVTG